ncbi:MAG: DRTGG domain-containing protein [bacterium]|nr:DRTGG domain-containing protein [bacterium]
MRLEQVIKGLALAEVCPGTGVEREVSGAYCSDMLSDVMAHAQPGDVWITVQTHQNCVAVAMMAELTGVVLTRGMRPDPEMAEKASREGVALLTTGLTSFEVAGRLFCLLRQERGEC